MCSGPDQLTSKTPSASLLKDMNDSVKIAEPEISLYNLLELAASNDVDGFKELITRITSAINEVGLWYCRERSSKRMLMEHRTPLMIAATYGSLDVVKFILSLSESDVNSSCGTDKTTALHCAASSGSSNALDVIKILLSSGADPELVDANGHHPVDVVCVPPNLPELGFAIENLLQKGEDCGLALLKLNPGSQCTSDEKKAYLVDPFLPDIKSDTYSSDEFRMFEFKIRPCSRAYSHDWTECPFIHPGESARRRDPRKIHYSCVPCPNFKKGQCQFGDRCEFAHGVFECWLHPAQYRTRLCKDGTLCGRRVCFFAHTNEELRPLYVSTGPTLPSPRGPLAPPMPYSPPPMQQLHGGSLQASRTRLSFNGRDLNADELMLLDLERHRRQQGVIFSPPHKPVLLNQPSPMNPYSPKGFYGISSPRMVSPRGIEQSYLAPCSPHLPKWDSAKENVDWSMNVGEMVQITMPQSMEPDVSWVQSLVKESPPPLTPKNSEMEPPETEKNDHTTMGEWLENMKLDHIFS